MFPWRCLIPFVAVVASEVFAEKKVVCYIQSWAAIRSDDGKFTVLDSDTEHCTHIIYAFLGLNESSSEIMSIMPNVDTSKDGTGEHSLSKLKQLKITNTDLKVMVSIGGWDQKSKRFSDVAMDPTKTEKFIYSVLHFLKEYELDGLDICWRYPTRRGGRRVDKENSVLLFKAIKDAFKTYGYILSVHILGTEYAMDTFNVKEVSDSVDFINLMGMEYNGPWTRTTGIIAPLRSKDKNNLEFSIEYMIMKGASRRKLLVGMTTGGHAYLLQKEPKNGNELLVQYAPDTFTSRWTNHGGTISYNEYCLDVKTNPGWTEIWDEESQTPIAYNGRKFVSIENATSLLKKAELVASKSLGGVAFWSLDMDDFRGLCDDIHYPLVSTVSDYLKELPDEPEIQPEEELEEETKEEQESAVDNYEESVQTTQRVQSTMSEYPPINIVKKSGHSSGSRIHFSNYWVLIFVAVSTTMISIVVRSTVILVK